MKKHTLHTFGCSITQGHALPDIVNPIVNPDTGNPYTEQEIKKKKIKINWEDIHLYQPSDYAWPKVLADKLDMNIINYARRGACFNQIARQCVDNVKHIRPGDTVIVMWTYLIRLSLQWPAKTSVPLCNAVDSNDDFKSFVLPGFNNLFGLSNSNENSDQEIYRYIENYTNQFYLHPLGLYDQYYNKMVLQQMSDGFLKQTGARVIHLSVESQSCIEQLEEVRELLDQTVGHPYNIPNPNDWYTLQVDHDSCRVIHDPSIPPAENDMHPSVTHHRNFANHIYKKYNLKEKI